MKEQKLKEWANMEPSEKIKWNGFDGFMKNETFRQTSIFNPKKSKGEQFR